MKGSRGDILISFCSPKAVMIASEAFKIHGDGLFELVPQKARKSPWTSTKTSWEVKITPTPSDLDVKTLCGFVKADRYWILPRSRDLVLSFKDKESAAQCVRGGILFSNYYLRAIPFTSKPKEFRIPRETCKVCLCVHSGECTNAQLCKCGSTAHTTNSCPKAHEALFRKRKSYRSALLGDELASQSPENRPRAASPMGEPAARISQAYREALPSSLTLNVEPPEADATGRIASLLYRLEERLSLLEARHTSIEDISIRIAASLQEQLCDLVPKLVLSTLESLKTP
jgi:hypothetical protein